jgi:hypothetical protein
MFWVEAVTTTLVVFEFFEVGTNRDRWNHWQTEVRSSMFIKIPHSTRAVPLRRVHTANSWSILLQSRFTSHKFLPGQQTLDQNLDLIDLFLHLRVGVKTSPITKIQRVSARTSAPVGRVYHSGLFVMAYFIRAPVNKATSVSSAGSR